MHVFGLCVCVCMHALRVRAFVCVRACVCVSAPARARVCVGGHACFSESLCAYALAHWHTKIQTDTGCHVRSLVSSREC